MPHLRSTLIALALATTSLLAQDPLTRIEKETARVTPAIVDIRHQIHQNPELSNREEKTAALVADYLRKLGLEVRTGVAKHGVIAVLKGGRSGPVVAPAMGSEDFSFFSNEVPGFMFRLGQVKPGTTTGDHHTPTFLADDSSVPVGIKVMSYALFDYLSRQK